MAHDVSRVYIFARGNPYNLILRTDHSVSEARLSTAEYGTMISLSSHYETIRGIVIYYIRASRL